jgi:hypothetical protein
MNACLYGKHAEYEKGRVQITEQRHGVMLNTLQHELGNPRLQDRQRARCMRGLGEHVARKAVVRARGLQG